MGAGTAESRASNTRPLLILPGLWTHYTHTSLTALKLVLSCFQWNWGDPGFALWGACLLQSRMPKPKSELEI